MKTSEIRCELCACVIGEDCTGYAARWVPSDCSPDREKIELRENLDESDWHLCADCVADLSDDAKKKQRMMSFADDVVAAATIAQARQACAVVIGARYMKMRDTGGVDAGRKQE